ncbi:MAG: type I-E CRISPR-associated protein Cas7/Cse4/CasC [Deltaproteobacteria bacterium]|nr:MAG: type I-E CRISPR-associated protein Cas7/Cse4/CasC [Deltaproteobacteria bacterium]
MTTFIQLHMLTFYPPSNLNRDELGRPKTAVVGGSTRLRISSQSLKRAWRTADLFRSTLEGNLGVRTKELGLQVYKKLRDKEVSEKNAKIWAKQIAGVFGKSKSEDKEKKGSLQGLEIEQLAHFSPEELHAIDVLIERLAVEKREPKAEELELLREKHSAVDIAMFGRMLADKPRYNMEAAVQVAHAFTVHEVAVEEDYFTAVDDLNKGDEDRGAAHLGEMEFGSGLFYGYICINRSLLEKNLNGDAVLARKALRALVETGAQVGPRGKQNSFASHTKAHYILAEKGGQQPRSLALAFADGIPTRNGKGNGILGNAKEALEDKRKKMDVVYGACADAHRIMDLETGEGTLKAILDFVTE